MAIADLRLMSYFESVTPHLVRLLIDLGAYVDRTRSHDLIRHGGTRARLLLQRKLWPMSFNPRPLSSSQKNAEPRCRNTNTPSLLLSYAKNAAAHMSL